MLSLGAGGALTFAGVALRDASSRPSGDGGGPAVYVLTWLVVGWLTGLLLGTLLGGLGFFYTWALHGNPAFAAVIGLAILFICMWANSVGAVIPMLAKRFGIDPAVVSAPLISTLVDATGLVIFYIVAIMLLINLGGAGTP